jgi:hypothetical protein
VKRQDLCPPELDELLNEWSRYFKDRHKWERAKSLEGQFNAFSPGAWDTGWGDKGEIPPDPLKPPVELRRVLKTHQAVQELEKRYKWSITLSYCYPSLNRWRVLKLMKKYTGRRFSWNGYLDLLEIARVRVWARVR